MKRRWVFYCLIAWLFFGNSICMLFLIFRPAAESNLLKNVEQQIQSEGKQMQAVSIQLSNLKKQYEQLSKDVANNLTFKEGLKFVLAAEGGVSNDAADSGGLTNLGITHTEYDAYRKQKALPLRSVVDISLKEARDIYKHTYWMNSGCGATPRRVALSCFDWEVNSGRGFSDLQLTLGGIAVDGIPGPETSNELTSWLSKPRGEDKLLHNYFDLRENRYRKWGVGSQRVFLNGWLSRAESLKNYLQVS